MQIVFRDFKKTDILDLFEISNDEWSEKIRELTLSLLKEYDNKIIKVILASNNDIPIGFIYGFILPNRTVIPEFLYVKPEFRNKKIGRR